MSDLADQKLAEEVAKLRIENRRLAQSPWLSPTAIVATGGLLLSIMGNVAQYRASQEASIGAARQADLAEQKWSEERLKLRAEVEALQSRNKSTSAAQVAREAQIAKINLAIDEIAKDLERVNVSLLNSKAYRDQARLWNEKDKIKEAEMAIERDLAELKEVTQRREGAIARRNVLEQSAGIRQ
jgi:hypothetical protein